MSAPFAEDDLYGLLQVESGSSAEHIRRAFRRQAMAWHPDRNDAPGAEHHFKRIRFAYDVLRDTERRAAYDRHVAAHPPHPASSPDATSQASSHNATHAGPSGHASAQASAGQRGADLKRRVTMTLWQQVHGGKLSLKLTRTEYCPACHGSGTAAMPPQVCAECNGSGEIRPPLGLFAFFMPPPRPCEPCKGTGKIVPACSACGGSGVKAKKSGQLRFDLPAGTRPGGILRVRGHGRRGRAGAAAGDLRVHVDLAEHPLFRADFPHLRCQMPVNVFRLLAGSEIAVPTLEGSRTLPLRPVHLLDTEIRLPGEGLRDGPQGERGDLIVTLVPDLPNEYSAEQIALLSELERQSADSPAQRDWGMLLKRAERSQGKPAEKHED